MKKIGVLFLILVFSVTFSRAQTAEVGLQLNEQFFEAMLDAIFNYSEPPEYPLAFNNSEFQVPNTTSFNSIFHFANQSSNVRQTNTYCRETIKIQRQIDGVRTAVRFGNGQIFAPIAFTGNYNPPLIGCIEFSGVAESVINLEFDRERQTLIGRARVTNVKMSGTRGVGSGVLARMVQGSIDKKVNPIQILAMDRVSFVVPIQNSGSIRMKAVGMRHEIANGALNVFILYEFQKP